MRKKLRVSLEPKLAKANPLRTIGFSTAVLALGFSEDELYEFTHATARILLARVHPDRAQTVEIREQQSRVSEAFELLKDRALFSEWLRDLSAESGAERSELNELRDADEILRANLEAARSSATMLRDELDATKQRRDAISKSLHDYLLSQSYQVCGPNVFTVEPKLSIATLHLTFYEQYEERQAKARHETLFSTQNVKDKGVMLPGIGKFDQASEIVRRVFSSCRPLPYVGMQIREFQTDAGKYDELLYQPKGPRIILGTVGEEDFASLSVSFGKTASSQVRYGLLVPVIKNEISQGRFLVHSDVRTVTLQGNSLNAQRENLRVRRAKSVPMASVSDLILAVHLSDSS